MKLAMKTSRSTGAKLHKTWRKSHSTVILRDQFLKFGFIWLEDKKQLTNKRKKETHKENSEQTSHQGVSLSKASTSSSLSAGRISS